MDPSADPQSPANHQTSSLAASQKNGGPTRPGGSSYPISLDNVIVSGFKPSEEQQEMSGSEPKLEVT